MTHRGHPGARNERTGRLYAVVGATGTGKSELSLQLAEELVRRGRSAEIVNADAMQLYHGMDIGTAKLSHAERRGIPHHLFDELAPSDEASVAWYQPRARAAISEIWERGADAILVGGSGLYVSSVVFHFDFPPRDAAVRARLEAQLEAEGIASLVEHLGRIAPDVARVVDARNPRRVIRALEVALLGGDAQVTLPREPELWHDETRIFGIRVARDELVERLDRRVDKMWATGMLEEVRGLIPHGLSDGPTASRAIGYAQALSQLRGEKSEADAIAEAQAFTRRYARRQVSWFGRYPGVQWLREPVAAGLLD